MLKLFNTLDAANVINKSLVLKKQYDLTFKEPVSVINPTLTLKIDNSFNIQECNYCFISDFNRYYFIQDIQFVNNGIYKIYLECDVLESFKDDILSSHAEIKKVVSEGDYAPITTNIDVRTDNDLYHSNSSLIAEKTMILSTIGG